MKYDFDKPTDRRKTASLKWDVAENELPMWIADMDFEALPEIREALQKTVDHGIFGYSSIPDEYFESISDYWASRHGYRFPTEDMVYCSGIVAAITSMVRKLTTPAENVLLQTPVYNIFYNCILNNGRNVVENQLIYDNGEWSIDFEDLERKLADPQTSMMIVCNPHNPVGKIWDKETLARIGDLCKKYGVIVVADEIHCSLVAPGKKYTPFASASETCRDISATCLAASKTFNIAGLQASCVIAHDSVLRHKIWRGINTDEVGEPNIFSMSANIAALRHGGQWVDELNEYIHENKKFAVKYITENMPKLKAYVAEATYLLWLDISAYSDDSVAFANDMRAKTGLYVNNGTCYGKGGERFLRINLATQRANVKLGMELLNKYISMLEA